jgi:hypothetical protein
MPLQEHYMQSRSRWSSLVATSLASLVAFNAAAAQSGSLEMDTRSNLYLAGGNSYTFSPVGGTGLAPTEIALNSGTGRVLSLSAFGSSFFCGPSLCGTTTPDGPAIGTTNVNGMGRIGGISAPTSGFLAAVFLGPSLPGSLPTHNVVSSIDELSYSPELGQVFFVGDGRTSGDLLQQFLVPDGATRMYFGIADASTFWGDPDFYDDNLGSYNIEYSVSGQSTPVPEPQTVALLAFGFGALGVIRRRRLS